jgi:hypothetical protein
LFNVAQKVTLLGLFLREVFRLMLAIFQTRSASTNCGSNCCPDLDTDRDPEANIICCRPDCCSNARAQGNLNSQEKIDRKRLSRLYRES